MSISSPLVRSHDTDAQWAAALDQFLTRARRRPVLIDYIFEPPDHIVPQRLYRYDVCPGYISRHRDNFEFGFDLILAISVISARRTYGVYVIELGDSPRHLYVGQTWYEPHERLAQHNTGFAAFHAARPFKRGLRGKLRPDLYAHLPRFRTQSEAEKLEASWALELKLAGYRVDGGH